METHYETMKRVMAPYRQEASEAADRGLPTGAMKGPWAEYALLHEYIRREVPIPDQASDPWPVQALFDTRVAILTGLGMQYRGASEGTVMSYLTVAWNQVCLERDGEKIFEVSPGLAQHLANTEVRNVQCEHLKLPFRTIYVVVPEAAGLIIPGKISKGISEETGGEFEGTVKVRGLYLMEMTSPVGRAWNLTVVADGDPGKKNDWTFYTFEQPLPDGKTVAEAMEIRLGIVSNPEFKRKYRADEVRGSYFTWAMNLALYLTYEAPNDVVEYWHNKEAERAVKRAKRTLHGEERRQAIRRATRDAQKRLYVGKDIPLLHPEETEAHPSREGKKLDHRVMVQGHWRNQACGTGFQERKLIWIKPFMKGPKGLPEANPRRIVT